VELGCIDGTQVNCSGYNIKEIATCDNNPDNIHYTWDYGAPFISVCDETNDVCTNGTQTLTHTCSVLNCSAECDSNDDCECQQDGCVGSDWYDYSEEGICLESCVCDEGACAPNISYNDPRCSHKVCDYQLQACAVVNGTGSNECATWEDCEYCGNGNVEPPEQCELPSTANNTYCTQSTSQCNGTKHHQCKSTEHQ
jgi:hypothetical protein